MPPRRRAILRSVAGASGILAAPWLAATGRGQAARAIAEAHRPSLAQGIMSGDVTHGRAMVWSATDRPARMHVQWDTTPRFANPRSVVGPLALDVTDYTARLDLTGLPPDQTIFYRVQFQDAGQPRVLSDWTQGSFQSAPAARRHVRIIWSADTGGQGFGINPDMGGMRMYDTMRRAEPDLFLHAGDTIYATTPLQAEKAVEGGQLWRNLVTPARTRPAQTLEEFRGCYRYNLLDEPLRRFNAEVAQVWNWSDHEVTNNWSSAKDLGPWQDYTEKQVGILQAHGTRAFLEYAPMRWHAQDEAQRIYRRIPYGPLLDVFVTDMRSYRGGNSSNLQGGESAETAYFGNAQVDWLLRELKASRALWKIVSLDMPLGAMVRDGQLRDAQGHPIMENSANGDGPPLGRELEIARLLRQLARERVRNVVFTAADVHYAAAHYYDPTRAQFHDFEPFWEFVAGPIHAGTAAPLPMDNTFGPQVVFSKGAELGQTLSPLAGLQFFGQLDVDAQSRTLSVQLKDASGTAIYRQTLQPRRA
ncbi:alkaline phosphatase D family protein [Acidovorax sp.]|uniref:alkaline phosphatase D family protein n=1 Tax=Acidovorax sp. TaxID=1872122 RepID=UPI003D03226F